VGQGNKKIKRDLGRNPFFKPGLFGPDQHAPTDFNVVGENNWLYGPEWSKGYGPNENLTRGQEQARQKQLLKLQRLKEEGHPWALKAENQKYYGDTSAPVTENKQKKTKPIQSGKSNTSVAPVDDGGRQAWLDATANSPAAKAFGNSEAANEMRWQAQLGHRDWLASNNRGSKYTINNKDARYESAKAEALGNAGSQTLEQSVLGRPGGAVMGAAIGTMIAPGIGTLIGGGLGALAGNNVLLPEGQTQATTENQQEGTRSVDTVQPVSGLEVGQQPNTKGFNAVSNSSQIMTHANQTGGFEGATGIGTANMQPNTALTTNNEAGVEPANVNGLDGNVDNPANDLVNQYKVQALGDFYIPSEDTDPLKYFRRDSRSDLGNKLMGKK